MAKTIYTYLYNDDLNGSRIITMDNCFCKLFSIRRTDVEFMQQFKADLEKPALYLLIHREKRKAYIGETDAFLTRLSQHIAKKEFWTEALAFISTDDSLSKTEVQYLESLAYSTANNMKSYDLSENTVVPKAPHMNYMLKSKTEEFFKYVQYLTKFIGCGIFEKSKTKSIKTVSSPCQQVYKPITKNINITSEDIKGKVTIIINGKPTCKGRLGVFIVKEYLREHPNTSIQEIKSIFHIGFLGSWGRWSMIEDDIKLAKSLKTTTGGYRHQTKPNFVLTSGDGVNFVVSNQWDSINSLNLLQFAQEQGWSVKIKKEEMK